jgi:hypothetical protein
MAKLIDKVRSVRKSVGESHKTHKAFHYTHGSFHLTYLAAVFIEGHGLYALAAGGLFSVLLIAMIVGIDD